MSEWTIAWPGVDRPPHEMFDGERFYALVGPDCGWPRSNPRPTIMRQRWEWSVSMIGKGERRVPGRYRREAEGHAPTRAKARACALAVLSALDGGT